MPVSKNKPTLGFTSMIFAVGRMVAIGKVVERSFSAGGVNARIWGRTEMATFWGSELGKVIVTRALIYLY